MKNLENYGVLELNAKEIIMTDGGWKNPITDWIVGEVIGAIVDFIAYDNASYGEWLVQTEGSHGAW